MGKLFVPNVLKVLTATNIFRFNADIQIPEACRVFINEYSKEIFNKNIRYNFVLHLNCLYDFGLLDANQMKTVIDQLNEMRKADQVMPEL